MIKDFVWSVFEKTGNIDNYMLYKQIEMQGTVQSDIKDEVTEAEESK